MSTTRRELREALCLYSRDTLTNIIMVKEFCVNLSTWTCKMEADLTSMKTIKVQVTAANKKEELEKGLSTVLKRTLKDLKKLGWFLDAVEKLAVTSLHVFMEENQQVLRLPRGIEPEHIEVVIETARLICPLLLDFKRDEAAFFLPKLQNVEVLSYQLDKYIQTTQLICERFQESGVQNHFQNTNKKVVVDLGVDLSGDEIQRMLCHINLLDEIRKDPNFRMVFLFQEVSCFRFIREFNSCKHRMLLFLSDLEESAVQLEMIDKTAKISSVAGSSVGVIGGALSIAGLALSPFTGGLSSLLWTGFGCGITSGITSFFTTVITMAKNRSQQNKANEVFKSFVEDIQSLQDCLEEVTSQPFISEVNDRAGENESSIVTPVVPAKKMDSEEMMQRASAVMVQKGKALLNMPKLAAEVPEVGQAAVKVPLALSTTARAGLITVNVFFIGMDVFYICKDGISLIKGSETEVSQFIRARAALWSSEMDSWQKIHDSLCEGQETSEKNKAVLGRPFYPEGAMWQKDEEVMEIPSE